MYTVIHNAARLVWLQEIKADKITTVDETSGRIITEGSVTYLPTDLPLTFIYDVESNNLPNVLASLQNQNIDVSFAENND